MQIIPGRRSFMTGMSASAATALLGIGSARADKSLLETTAVRLPKIARTDCQAAGHIAEELLQVEEFTDVRFANRFVEFHQ
jgi:hypothetical protein